MEEKAGDVSEKSAVVPRDALLGDESEKLRHDAAEFVTGAKFGTAGEEFVGDGLDFGVRALFVEAFMNDAESGGCAAEWIEAAPTMGGSVAAAILQRDLSS